MKQAVFAVGRLVGTLLLVVMASSAFAVEELSLEYDAEGNVQYLTTPDGTTDYDYDAIYRLTDEDGPYHTETYGYDANGNRTSDNPGTLEYPVSPSPPSSRVSNRVTTGGTTPYVHDANGNVTDDGTYEYVYNQRGLLEQVKQSSTVIATYYYDYRNRRTRKVTSAGTTVYHYDQWDKLIGETTTTSEPDRTYVYGANDAPVAQVSDDGLAETVAYLSTDHIATPRLGKDADRRVVWRWDRDAFGDLPADSDPDGDLTATSMNLRFPGQYYDAETGLHYNWNRYYAPDVGRYLQSDPIGLAGGLNTYAYVGSNPLRYFDPSGLERKRGKNPPKLWPTPPSNVVGKKPKWNPDGYYEGKKDRNITWDDRSHGSGIDRGDGPQGGHWDDENSNNRWDEDGNPLPGSDEYGSDGAGSDSRMQCDDGCQRTLIFVRDVLTGAMVAVWACLAAPFAN